LNYTRMWLVARDEGRVARKSVGDSVSIKFFLISKVMASKPKNLEPVADYLEATALTPFLATRPSSLATRQLYMFSIASPYAATTFARLTFRVGVSRPFSTVQGWSRGVTRRMRA